MGLKRRINYQWRLFIPIATALCLVFGVLIYYQYKREANYRAQVFSAELDLIDSRILEAYRQDVNLRTFLSFIQQFFQGSMFEGVRVSVYRDDRLYYSLGVPIPLDMSDVDIRKRDIAGGNNIEGVEGNRAIGRDDDQLYFFSSVKSDDKRVTVLTAMPYSDSVHDAIDIDSTVTARDTPDSRRNTRHSLYLDAGPLAQYRVTPRIRFQCRSRQESQGRL